jgi:hypothetical protein
MSINAANYWEGYSVKTRAFTAGPFDTLAAAIGGAKKYARKTKEATSVISQERGTAREITHRDIDANGIMTK